MNNRGSRLLPLLVVLTLLGGAWAQDGVEVVARWKHLGKTITLYSNGKINNPSGHHTWSKAGNTLTLRWKDAKAPGGFWIDTCTISPNGQSYKGTNQLRRPITGTLVKAPPKAKAGEKPEVVVKPAAPNSGPDGAKPSGPALSASKELWKVLQLVSLEYELNYQKVPREHALLPYVPLMSSTTGRVREVAALSARWEITVWDVQKAAKEREASVSKGVFGGIPVPRPAGAMPAPVQPETPASVEAALAKAEGDGMLLAYKMIDRHVKEVADEKEDGDIGKMSQASAEFYRTQLVVALKQAVLWNKAESLARSVANGDNTRGNDIDVRGVFEPGKTWGTVILRNKSAADLDHVTFTLLAPTLAMPPGNPALDFFLGAGVVGAGKSNADVNDPDAIVASLKAGFNLKNAVANYRAYREMPVRVFVHVPKLAAGKECEVRLFRTSAEFAKTHSATYSVWAERVAIRGKPLPGYEEAKNNKAAPGANIAADPKNPFPKGSIWRGTVKWTQAGVPDITRKTQITVTARNGENFKGTIVYEGSRARSDIVGVVADGAIKFEFQTAKGKRGLLHTGTLKGTRLEFTYEEGGDKPRKSVTVLNRVPPGKK